MNVSYYMLSGSFYWPSESIRFYSGNKWRVIARVNGELSRTRIGNLIKWAHKGGTTASPHKGGTTWSCQVLCTRLLSQCVQTDFYFYFLIVCFPSYFVFSIAVLPHSPDVVYYHLLLKRETRIPGVAPFSFSNRNLGSFCS